MEANKPKGFIDAFMDGGQKGVRMWALHLLPGTVFGFVMIEVLTIFGVLDIVGRIFGPLMGLFGLPGEAVTVWLTSFLAIPAGVAAALSLIANGLLDGRQVAILIPMMFMVSNQIQLVGRMLAVSQVPNRKYIVILLISVICSLLSGLIMNLIV